MDTGKKFRVSRTLESYGGLREQINKLSVEEVISCLDIEIATTRRPTVIRRLIARAVRLNEMTYRNQLMEKYHAPSSFENR